ncbi:hypothetical protein TCE0_018r06205 [Talaromyces pinophilus]|uniref:Uncharacterized protein n=1 Tax=Talaromyces pinophilus TaxID=128442 RepID=A0A510NXH8_TALPI|nr:hypothetical protein TCE0_018r06205 [Talaromyces pinophilus]
MRVLIVVIAGFSNSERHDMRVGICHLSNESFAVIRCEEMVLRSQCVAHFDIKGLQPDATDRVVRHPILLHQLVDVNGQVSSVEAADTNMDDPLLDGAIAARSEIREGREMRMEKKKGGKEKATED